MRRRESTVPSSSTRPRLPCMFDPQHTTLPSLLRAQNVSPGSEAPPAICATFVSPATRAGFPDEPPAPGPRPSSPEVFAPQHCTVPSWMRTHTEWAPAAISTAHGATVHAIGTGLASTSTVPPSASGAASGAAVSGLASSPGEATGGAGGLAGSSPESHAIMVNATAGSAPTKRPTRVLRAVTAEPSARLPRRRRRRAHPSSFRRCP